MCCELRLKPAQAHQNWTVTSNKNIVRVSLDLSWHSNIGVRIWHQTWKHGLTLKDSDWCWCEKYFLGILCAKQSTNWILSICLWLMMAPSNRIMHCIAIYNPVERVSDMVEWVICVIYKQQICNVIKSTWTQISGEYFWHLIESAIKKLKQICRSKWIQPVTRNVYLMK